VASTVQQFNNQLFYFTHDFVLWHSFFLIES
jgi:hypothetical protein